MSKRPDHPPTVHRIGTRINFSRALCILNVR
jgi:hypothetical protein